MHSDKQFEMWLRGEIRTDGHQSQWLKDTLRRRAEDLAAEKEAKKAKAVRECRALPPRKKRYDYPPSVMGRYRYGYQEMRAKRRERGVCVDCGGKPRPQLRTCKPCSDKRKPYANKNRTKQRQLKAAA